VNDRLLVTLTFPDGTVKTFEKSTFIDEATGRTAVNAGGGTVRAKDDPRYELRIPEGALDKGVIFTAQSYTPAEGDPLPQIADNPDFPDAVTGFGAGIQWTVSDPNVQFKKEVDLAYPVPAIPAAAAAKGYTNENAFFYIFRRMKVGENADHTPQYAFRAIDEAKIEGTGADARVVTKSPPFTGVRDPFNALIFPTAQPLAAWGVDAAHAVLDTLMASYDAVGGQAVCVGITGTVRRAEYVTDPETQQTQLVSKGVPGARVFLDPAPGLSDLDWLTAGVALWKATFPGGATSTGPDGRFAFWMFKKPEGEYHLRATDGNKSAKGRLYQTQPADALALGLGLRYKQVFTTTLTLPAVAPPATPAEVSVHLFHRGALAVRIPETSGFILKGTTLLIGVKIANDADELRTIELTRDSESKSIPFQDEYLPTSGDRRG
jgi:hypothetical protein